MARRARHRIRAPGAADARTGPWAAHIPRHAGRRNAGHGRRSRSSAESVPRPAQIPVPTPTRAPTRRPEPTPTWEPEPTLTRGPEPTPTPVPEPDPEPEPVPTRGPEPTPRRGPEPEPTPTRVPEPTSGLVPEPVPTPEPESISGPVPGTETRPTPAPTSIPTPNRLVAGTAPDEARCPPAPAHRRTGPRAACSTARTNRCATRRHRRDSVVCWSCRRDCPHTPLRRAPRPGLLSSLWITARLWTTAGQASPSSRRRPCPPPWRTVLPAPRRPAARRRRSCR